jgi:diguanylate cyclase (GGDEF)-like protein
MINVLLIEDSVSTQLLITQKLEKAHFKVTCATSLQNSAKILDNTSIKFDYAILDINLPDTIRDEIVDFIVEKKKIPSIVYSANYNYEHIQKLLRRPIIDYVIKNNESDLEYIINLLKTLEKNKKKKLLLVGNTKIYTHTLVNYLSPLLFSITTVKSTQEAIKVLNNSSDIALVITDDKAPKIDGGELLLQIRKLYSRHQLIVLGLLSNDNAQTKMKMLKFGANGFISSDFTKNELLTSVNSYMDLYHHIEEVQQLTITDPLTQIHNRLFYEKTLNKEIIKAAQNKTDLCLAIIDIDFFKKINDKYGHDVGDTVLIEFSEVVTKSKRELDYFCRIGGEEFVLIIPNLQEKEVKDMLETIRIEIQNYHFSTVNNITASIGLSMYCKNDTSTSLFKKVDEALYTSKTTGRNKVTIR